MPLKIFYIDDEIDLCENFSDLFSSSQNQISTFLDPEKAIEDAKKSPPHIIFIDYRLTTTTGDKVAQIFDPKIPKFLITGEISLTTIYQFDKIILKPFSEDEILQILKFHQK